MGPGALFSCLTFCNLLLPLEGMVNLMEPGGGGSNEVDRVGGGGGGGGGGGRLGKGGGAAAFPELEVTGGI
jgi:hypothetical protein